MVNSARGSWYARGACFDRRSGAFGLRECVLRAVRARRPGRDRRQPGPPYALAAMDCHDGGQPGRCAAAPLPHLRDRSCDLGPVAARVPPHQPARAPRHSWRPVSPDRSDARAALLQSTPAWTGNADRRHCGRGLGRAPAHYRRGDVCLPTHRGDRGLSHGLESVQCRAVVLHSDGRSKPLSRAAALADGVHRPGGGRDALQGDCGRPARACHVVLVDLRD